MPLNNVSSPFPMFFDASGAPLDGGFVYVGEYGANPETNPITVYYDEGLTVPAAQPLFTSGGYILRNGSPATIFTDRAFSIMAKTKMQTVVFSADYSGSVGSGGSPYLLNSFAEIDSRIVSSDATGNQIAMAIGSKFEIPGVGSYEVVASGETFTNANGVKIKVLRSLTGTLPATAVNADDTASLQSAVNAGQNVISLPNGAITLSGTVNIPENVSFVGPNNGVCTINYTGTGTGLSVAHSDGLGSRIYNSQFAGFRLLTSTGAVGIDVESLSEGWFQDVIISGFTTGLALHSGISGGAVYNRFHAVKAQSCGTGFYLYRNSGTSSYTNDNVFYACRANICSVAGWHITGGNHNVIHGSQIEASAIGVLIEEPATATTQRNTVALSRFENNTADIQIGAGVAETILGPENWYVNGDRITDSGTRTQFIGAGPKAHIRSSGFQLAGGSYRYVRTANGGTQVPHTVLNEASSVNSPVTLEIQNPASSTDARALRVRYGGDAGTVKFGIVPVNGKLIDLATSNGPVGAFTLSAAAATVVNNTAVSASSLIFLQPANPSAAQLVAAKGAYVSARTAGTSFQVNTGDATAAAGTEVFWYWLVN